MDRISKIARPLGIAIAVAGIAMVAVSAYYLYAYMRSGSDADEFNVDAAAPDQQLALLGQGLPMPTARDGERQEVVEQHEPSSEGGAVRSVKQSDVGTSEDVQTVLSDEERFVGTETVLISSVFPGAVFSGREDAYVSRDMESQISAGELARLSGDSTGDVSVESDALEVVEQADGSAPRVVVDVVGRSDAIYSGVAVDAAGSEGESFAASYSTSELVGTFGTIYPGGNMNPRYWSEPHWAGNLPFGGPTIPQDFVPVDASDATVAAKSGDRALRMRIPLIDLDATVAELEILDLGDSRAWSTPDKVVGHIPTTADPGELANGWYFGHLDNFLSNEGDIFRRLPEISALLKNEYVDIFITTSKAEYMYRVTATRQVHRDDLYLTESDNSQISLVTCWPFRVYDHRIVVSASLIAMKPLHEV